LWSEFSVSAYVEPQCGEKCADYVCETISYLFILYIKTLDPHLTKAL